MPKKTKTKTRIKPPTPVDILKCANDLLEAKAKDLQAQIDALKSRLDTIEIGEALKRVPVQPKQIPRVPSWPIPEEDRPRMPPGYQPPYRRPWITF